MNLEEQIKYHQDKYYNETQEISDAEFDALLDKLLIEKPESPLLKDIGDTSWKGWPKASHNMMMGSQDKFNNEKDFRDWLRVKDIKFPILLQHKLDGLSIELQYIDGIFTKAVTRGDGYAGDDVTRNVSRMRGVPEEVDVNWTGSIRGEILLKNTMFEKYFKDAKNPRNMASGITKRKSGAECDLLSVIVYDALGNIEFETETDKFRFLDDEEFETVYTKFYNTPEEILEERDNIISVRDSLDIAIDGIVLKQDIIVESDLSRKRPEYQRAFKFETEQAVTQLLDVEWSRSGYNYTPVAILEPVDLMGSTVKRASLANLDNIRHLGLAIGDDVLIHKAGEIIPQILKVVKGNEVSKLITNPTECELCCTDLVITGARIFCPNLSCDGRKFHRLEKWIAKTGVKGFGPSLLNRIFDDGLVENLIDLYTVDVADKAVASTNLKKATAKAFANLYKIKEMKLETFVSGFDIEGIGEGVVKFAVDAGYDTLKKLYDASIDDFMKVEGFSEGRATLLFVAMKDLYVEMDILSNEVKIKEKKEKVKKMDKLEGKSFCFTGKLDNMTRDEAQDLVSENGGVSKSGVSKGLSYLVTNTPDSGSSKNSKAESLGTEIITESQFMMMLLK